MTRPRLVIAGRYRLDAVLASGGMGVVWRGWDERLERVVAIKQIRLQPGLSPSQTTDARDRALREARITARLHHPGAVPIYDVVEHDGQPCLIMQFLPSVSLQATLARRRTLPALDVARIGSELAAALSAAHGVGIVHRDVKPGNVLLAEDGSAKLTDFGISHAMGDVSLTSTGMVTGTPAFLSPEVARGQPATYASDVFSLGATLYTATEGHPPVEHEDNPMAVLHRVASGDLTPPRRSGPLTPLLLQMLNPDPAARPTMHDTGAALSSLHRDLVAMPTTLSAELTTTLPSPPGRPDDAAQAETVFSTRALGGKNSRFRSRKALLLLAGLGAISALAVALVYFLPGTGGSSGQTGASSAATRATPRSASTAGTRSTSPAATSADRSTAGSISPPSSRVTSSPPRSATSTSTSPSASTSTSSSATNPTSSNRSSAAGSTKAQLAQAVTDYYSLMPGNVDAGWSRLAPGYQSAHAGGFASYRRFWGAIQSVSTSDVVGQPPDSVTATITYRYKDGRTVVERTRYGFVRANGQWLISTSMILSSRTT